MQTDLSFSVLLLNKWGDESSSLIGSFGSNGITVVFAGIIKHRTEQRFVISEPAGAVSPINVTIVPQKATGFEYTDTREVPDFLRNQEKAPVIICCLTFYFGDSCLMLYEIEKPSVANVPH